MNKENCALKSVDEIILYYDARSKKHQIRSFIIRVLHITKLGIPLYTWRYIANFDQFGHHQDKTSIFSYKLKLFIVLLIL